MKLENQLVSHLDRKLAWQGVKPYPSGSGLRCATTPLADIAGVWRIAKQPTQRSIEALIDSTVASRIKTHAVSPYRFGPGGVSLRSRHRD